MEIFHNLLGNSVLMISNGDFRSSSFFIQDFLTLECFLSIVHTIAYYCTAICMLYLNCARDFCEIFIFTTLKITERVIWTLKVVGFVQNPLKNESAHSFRGIGTQTNISHAEQKMVTSTLDDVQIPPLTTSLNRREPLNGNLNCEVCLPSPQRKIESTLSCNALDEPAVLIVNNDKATTTEALKETPQSPICRVHLTPFPTNLRTKYAKVADNLSSEERWNLKRKWQKWSLKNNAKKQCVSMQSLFSSNPEKYSSEERKPKKAKLSFDNCDCYRNETILEEEESPEVGSIGCYKNVMSRLKSRFMRRDSPFATYKTF